MNKNIEVINENMWAVRFSHIPWIPELGYTGQTDNLESQIAAFTADGKVVLNKQHEIYPTLKAMLQRAMTNSDQELIAKANSVKNKEQGKYERFYLFVLDTEIKRRTVYKDYLDSKSKFKGLIKFFDFWKGENMATIRTAIQLQDGVTSVMRSMNNAMNICISSFETLQNVSSHAVNTANISAARAELTKATIAMDNVERNIHEATAAQQKFNAEVRQSHSVAEGLAGKFKLGAAALATAAIAAATAGVKQVMNMSDTVAQNAARLDMMNDGMQTAAELQDKIFQSAQRARGVYQSTLDAVSRLGMQAGQAFTSNDELIAFTEQLNKTFVIARTSAVGVDSVMLQLTQSMAAGRLQGEELNAVLDNAQPIVANIQRYLQNVQGFPKSATDNIKQLASDGVITAQIIKNAMFYAADETNRKFESMPRTFGDVWNSIENNALKSFQPVLKMVNSIANSSGVTSLVNGAIGGLNLLGAVAANTFAAVSNSITWGMQAAGSMLQFLGNIILEVMPLAIGGLAAYGSYWLVTNANMIVNSAISAAVAARTWLIVTAQSAWAAVTQGVIAAQRMLNLVLSMNPLGFVITLVATVIAFFGTWQVVTYGLRNTFADVFGFIVDTVQSAVNLIVSSINTVVRSFNAIGGFVGKIMGFEYSNIAEIAYRADFSGVKSAGQNFIKDFSMDSLYKNLDINIPNSKLGLGSNLVGFDPTSAANIADTAANTAQMKDSLSVSEESLLYMRDIAEQEVINRFTTAEIKIDMTNHNTINNEMDIDGIVSVLETKLEESMQIAAEGVHL